MSNVVKFNKKQQDPISSFNQSNSAAITPASAPVQVTQNAQQGPASSGQFTNVQKYLNANKQAGQEVAQNVNQQVTKNLEPIKQEATDTASRIADQVKKANTAITEGEDIQKTISAPAQAAVGIAKPSQEQQVTTVTPVTPVFNAQEFIKNEDNLKKLIQHQSGQAVNSKELTDSSDLNKTMSDILKKKAITQDDLTKTNTGRTGLIQQTFGRAGYTSGQNRLDNTFLSGNKKGLQDIQNKTQQEISKASRMADDANNVVQAVQNQDDGVIKRASDLSGALKKQTAKLSNDYISQLNDQITTVNDQRQEEQNKGKAFVDQLIGKTQSNNALDESLWNELKLREGESTFNVFDNLTPEQVFKYSQQKAQNTQDVATQADVDYYKALAMMQMGNLDDQGKLIAPREDQLALSKASQLEKALSAIEGQNSVRSRLDDANKKFIADAINKTISGYGSDSGSRGWDGSSGSDANVTLQTNLASTLGLSPEKMKEVLTQSGPNLDSTKAILAAGTIADPSGISQAVALVDKYLLNEGLSNNISQMISSSRGASDGSIGTARLRASHDLLNNTTGALVDSGVNKLLTKSGMKTANLGNIYEASANQLNNAANMKAAQSREQMYNDISNILSQYSPDQLNKMDETGIKSIVDQAQAIADKNPYYGSDFSQIRKNMGSAIPLLQNYLKGQKDYVDSVYNKNNEYRDQIAKAKSEISNMVNGKETLLDKILMPYTDTRSTGTGTLPNGVKGTVKLGSK